MSRESAKQKAKRLAMDQFIDKTKDGFIACTPEMGRTNFKSEGDARSSLRRLGYTGFIGLRHGDHQSV